MIKASEILDIINKYADDVPENFSTEDYIHWVHSFLNHLETEIGQKVIIKDGASKLVLIPENENYVIKIPFLGHNEEEWIENEDYPYKWGDPEYDGDKAGHYEYIFYPFDGASFDGYNYDSENGENWNYCNAEVDIYELAVLAGLELYFAREELIGFIDGELGGYPVYVQERAVTYNDSQKSYDKASENEIQELREKYANHGFDEWHLDSIHQIWALDFIAEYGEEEYFRFFRFCYENALFEDMHYNNFGYIVDTYPVLIDYSNYRS